MNKIRNLSILILCVFCLVGCESVSRSLGLTHEQPDEFLVSRNKPLSVPDNYKLTKPYTKTQQRDASQDKAKALLGYYEKGAKQTSGASESVLLSAASGGDNVDENIRDKVDADANLSRRVPKKLVKAVASWKKQINENFSAEEK